MLTAPRTPNFLTTLLYYFGVLTFAGRNALGELQLTIPNQVIRKLCRPAPRRQNRSAITAPCLR